MALPDLLLLKKLIREDAIQTLHISVISYEQCPVLEWKRSYTDAGQDRSWFLYPSPRFSAPVRYFGPAPLRDRTTLAGPDSRHKCVHFNFDSDPGIFLTLSISLIDNGLISDLFFI